MDRCITIWVKPSSDLMSLTSGLTILLLYSFLSLSLGHVKFCAQFNASFYSHSHFDFLFSPSSFSFHPLSLSSLFISDAEWMNELSQQVFHPIHNHTYMYILLSKRKEEYWPCQYQMCELLLVLFFFQFLVSLSLLRKSVCLHLLTHPFFLPSFILYIEIWKMMEGCKRMEGKEDD